MSALLLDAGAFVAAERDDRETMLRIRRSQQAGLDLRTTAVVVTQVWRDPGGRQAKLARLLKAVDVRTVDEDLGRAAGVMLGQARTTDAVDATVVTVAAAGDRILTSNPDDLERLVSASGRSIVIVTC